MKVKEFLGKVVSRQKILGFVDFVNYKNHKSPWGCEFNGQELRRKIFDAVLDATKFKIIIETGTYRGTTTSYFAKKNVPVYTGEYSPRFYSFSRFRFLFKKRVKVFNNDSRIFLRQLSKDAKITKEVTFFYLDAHWDADLPLAEELQIISGSWQRNIIMIDDFKVPGDYGYAYDDYGGDSVLDGAYIDRVGIAFWRFYPVSSSKETGVKSGSILLTSDKQIADQLRTIDVVWEDSKVSGK